MITFMLLKTSIQVQKKIQENKKTQKTLWILFHSVGIHLAVSEHKTTYCVNGETAERQPSIF